MSVTTIMIFMFEAGVLVAVNELDEQEASCRHSVSLRPHFSRTRAPLPPIVFGFLLVILGLIHCVSRYLPHPLLLPRFNLSHRSRKFGSPSSRMLHEIKNEVLVPDGFRCPISLDVMKDPVTVSSGITYDRRSIKSWLDAGNIICPVTRQVLRDIHDLIPNHTLRRHIQQWYVVNREMGIERISSTKTSFIYGEIAHILGEVSAVQTCGKALRVLRSMAEVSYRNRKMISSTDAGSVIASAFLKAAAEKSVQAMGVCEEALATLAAIAPLKDDARVLLASPSSLDSVTRILLQGSHQGKSKAAVVLQELATDGLHCGEVRDMDGLAQALVQMIKEPLSLRAAKAVLSTIYYIASNNIVRVKLVNAGAVPILLEILPEADKTTCERSFAALDLLYNCAEGRSAAYEHALTMPVILKKILRVSNLATDFAVSILWTLCRHSPNGHVMLDALQSGAFQKLLVLIQLGCSEKTRKRAGQLLKLFGHYKDEWECIDTIDFKDIKRSFETQI